MLENMFPDGAGIPARFNPDALAEVSAMASFSSLAVDWILADPARFEQFMSETAELDIPEGGNPDDRLTLEAARHLAEHADSLARHMIGLANRMRELRDRNTN